MFGKKKTPKKENTEEKNVNQEQGKKKPAPKKTPPKKPTGKKTTENNPLGLEDEVSAPEKKISDKNKRSSKDKVDNFMRRNSYITLIAIFFTFFYLNSKLGTLTDVVENTLVRNTHYIKENIGKPIFLTANGIILTAKKSEMSLYDERFKTYLTNILVENTFQGLVKISKNFKVIYRSPSELYEKNAHLKTLDQRFFTPNTSGRNEYMKLLYQYIIEDKLPQYVDVLGVEVSDYFVRGEKSEAIVTNGKKDFSLNIKVTVITKSWIKALGDYDTVTSSVYLKVKGVIDSSKYADIGNPFGIKFTEVAIPVLRKRTPLEITQEGV